MIESQPPTIPRKLRMSFALLTQNFTLTMIARGVVRCFIIVMSLFCSLVITAVVRALRSRKSDLSTYSYHYWGSDAYNTGESRAPSSDTSSQLSSPSRTSTGMQLGGHATFNQCNITILNMQSNDSSSVSDATSNLGTGFVGRGSPFNMDQDP